MVTIILHKPLEDVDSLIESYRKNVNMYKNTTSKYRGCCLTSSRPSTAFFYNISDFKPSAVDPIISQPSTSRRDKGILRKIQLNSKIRM